MSKSEKPKYILKAKEIEGMKQKFSHPWNPKSEIIGARLGVVTGLRRTGVNMATIPPGRSLSFITRTSSRKNGYTCFPGMALPRYRVRSTKWSPGTS